MATAVDSHRRHRDLDGPNEWLSSPQSHRAVIEALRALLGALQPPPALLESEEVVMRVELEGTRYSLAQRRAPDARPTLRLSAREQEIARLISAGHTNKTVAAVLEISLWTVDTHIRRIFAKLGVRSRSAMVAQLAEYGLLGPETPR